MSHKSISEARRSPVPWRKQTSRTVKTAGCSSGSVQPSMRSQPAMVYDFSSALRQA